MIYTSVTKCDIDIRRELFNNVIVTGGNSLIAGIVSISFFSLSL